MTATATPVTDGHDASVMDTPMSAMVVGNDAAHDPSRLARGVGRAIAEAGSGAAAPAVARSGVDAAEAAPQLPDCRVRAWLLPLHVKRWGWVLTKPRPPAARCAALAAGEERDCGHAARLSSGQRHRTSAQHRGAATRPACARLCPQTAAPLQEAAAFDLWIADEAGQPDTDFPGARCCEEPALRSLDCSARRAWRRAGPNGSNHQLRRDAVCLMPTQHGGAGAAGMRVRAPPSAPPCNAAAHCAHALPLLHAPARSCGC